VTMSSSDCAVSVMLLCWMDDDCMDSGRGRKRLGCYLEAVGIFSEEPLDD